MKRSFLKYLCCATALFGLSAAADELQERVSRRSERAVLDKSTAAKQARIEADNAQSYGFELRPSVSENDAGLALRILLPDRWNKAKLREQLLLAAESEQLRVSALEWRDLMQAYRLFCDYRMMTAQLALYEKELSVLEPYLQRADEAVELHQLAVVDRAKFYSLYLDLVNGSEKLKADLLENEQALRLLLGADADLRKMADAAKVEMPLKTEFEALLQQALENRADYRQFDLQARAWLAAEQNEEKKDGFWLRYIQPEYEVNYNNGEDAVSLSAAIVLPWGTREPDLAVYQQQRRLALSSMQLQRMLIEERLKVLLKSAEAYYESVTGRNARIRPLLKKVAADMETMNTGRLEDMRDILQVRERIFEVSLQTAAAIRHREKIAVDLAEELGVLSR